MKQTLHLNVMTACYTEEPEEDLDGYRDYSTQPHLKRRAVVHLFCRDKNGKRYVIRDWRGTFKPYFYVPSRSDNKSAIVDLFGRKVKKHGVNLPRDVPAAREGFKFTDEANILFEKRFQIDKGIRCGMYVHLNPPDPAIIEPAPDLDVMPRKLYYDCEMPIKGEPNIKEPEAPVCLITSFDSYTDNMYAHLMRPPMIRKDELKQVFLKVTKAWKDRGYAVHVIDCPNEFQTINQWVGLSTKIDPDHLIAHNGDRFDFPYLNNRCRKKHWGIMRRLSPVGKCFMQGYYPRIDGKEHIDFCGSKEKHDGMYTNFTVQDVDVPSLRLEDLAEHELGYKYRFGKIGYLTYDLWHSEDPHDIFKLLYYGFEDAWVMPSIDRKRGMSDRYEIFRRLYGCTTRDGLSNSIFIDVGCLRETDKPLPTKVKQKDPMERKTKKKQIEGAIVIRPRAGMHGDIPVNG